MELQGTIKMIDTTKDVGATFKKRDLVITTDEQYPQHILVQFVQDKCDLLNNFKVGDGVEVGINLRGREWVNPQGETVYFNTIQGWKINKLQVPQDGGSSTSSFEPASNFTQQDMDDMPF